MLSQQFKWSLAIAAALVIGGAAVHAQAVDPFAPKADTQTLELVVDDAETSPVHFYRNRCRSRFGYSYSYSYYRPRYYGYRSYSYYRPYYGCYYRPICDDGCAIVVVLGDCPTTEPTMPYVAKTEPTPNEPPDGNKKQFPYDGGPKQPVPMPSPDKKEKPAVNPQVPDGDGFLVSFPTVVPQHTAYEFSAYGENVPQVTESPDELESAAPVSRVAPANPPFEYPAFGE